MFIGRKRELQWLQEQYESNKYEMSIIYGRRRVGKTTLLSEFIKDKKAIFYLATQANAQTNLEIFSKKVLSILQPDMPATTFRSFDDAFLFISTQAKKERILMVIDEYPYLADAVEGFASILQRAIDLYFKNSNVFLILSGSSISFMEQQVLSEKSPLFGRKTAQYKIEPFSYAETLLFLHQMDAESVAILYGATGGVAEYLSFVNQNASVADNLIRLFFERRGRLYEEPKNFLHQELRDPRLYNEILSAIARGKTKNNEIASTVSKTPSEINHALKTLQELGIIRKESPVGKNGSKKPIYQVADQMFRFWYRFVYYAQSEIAIDNGQMYFMNIVEPNLSDYMGHVFEEIVLEFMQCLSKRGALPEFLKEQGRWWGPDKMLKKQVEIDYVGLGNTYTLIGEAKWRNTLFKGDDLKELEKKGDLFTGIKQYFLFSKTGFTKELLKRQEECSDLKLYDLASMVQILESSDDPFIQHIPKIQ